MEVKVVQELERYSHSDIVEWLGEDEDRANHMIQSLIVMNILKKNYSDTVKFELRELIEIEDFEGDINKNNYVFIHVGMVIVGKVCFFVYPKYINDVSLDAKNGYKKFKQILSVIRKYKSKEQLYMIAGTGDTTEFNLLSFTLDLLQDYYENGLYSSDKVVIEENGSGEILWEKSINENNVYFSNKIPVYLDFYTVNDVLNEEDIFRRLHRLIITKCCEEIKEILEILAIPHVMISDERLENFGNKEYIKYQLMQEITQQFVSRKQAILYKMITYIERKENNKSIEGISFVGTNSFNLVWEDVCSCVMDNCLNKTLSEIGLKSYGDKKTSDMLINLIPKPKWKHNKSGIIHEAKKTLIPDLISIHDGKLSIYDAKYYKIKLDQKNLNNNPGIGDITKQYLYELSYRKLADKNKLEIDRNAFLMPSDGDKEEVLGIASIDIFSDYDKENMFNDIEIILKPCEAMYKEYIRKG